VELLAREGDSHALANQIAAEFMTARADVWRALAVGQPQFWPQADTALDGAAHDLAQLQTLTTDAERAMQAKALSPQLISYKATITELRKFETFNDAINIDRGQDLLNNGETVAADILERTQALGRLYDASAAGTETQSEGAASRALQTVLWLTTVSVIVAIVFAILVVRSIRRPIANLTRVAGALARGDLLVGVPHTDEANEFGELARAFEALKLAATERNQLEAASANASAQSNSERERRAVEAAEAARELAEAMGQLGVVLHRLAEGDLTTRLDAAFPAKFGRIHEDFNEAASRLGAAVRAVADGAGAIQSCGSEIASVSAELSKGNDRQAASLKEAAAALGEITTTVRHAAKSAKHAAGVVANANVRAQDGSGVVDQAFAAMDAIAKSSTEIGQIIGVIDEIAFQTNLLALNAGVEAARAGDAGRGFAVVASEVRALAQRSAEAAKEIKALISASTTQVAAGVNLVSRSGQALEQIIAQVAEINGIVANIAKSSEEQAEGLQQVNSAVGEMDQATQQNATMVEQATAASRSLSKETMQLVELVEQFRLTKLTPSLPGAARTTAPQARAKPRLVRAYGGDAGTAF
jgi:methyl-accepting chemotaxis protein